MFNKVILVGNLTRDVELRYLPSGIAVATIGLASNRRYKKQDGSIADDPCFVDVKLFGRTAEIANQYLRKGSKVLIEGRLTYETWIDQMGVKKSKHTITAESMSMLDSKGGNLTEEDGTGQNVNYGSGYENYPSPRANPQVSPASNTSQKNYSHNVPEIDINEDEIPF
ncbi:single-stranded DNA-binding protein [Helicobacter mustelae]|uniref:Single-stranded DNA-binding protein n=1 Tax=Helicobacter mustelae (strain ATCC 43772 / CCUG 25715 / CIP 103759 / LMG 18044 / NCTC 12198 / R85-136P) TaxID=679897 RepID=D3UJ32_HELM1|nr:single-stranded DNA-binding protein [Helicobacter mustelae]CBG40507.1 single-strand DNA binding protein [Helicobacter mustelae 12198]SQH72005.1 single-strand DNA binding protein [Helicobacter mustelae]STP13148.1 single-strand DNA binding protein [Helicobacter mustelae]